MGVVLFLGSSGVFQPISLAFMSRLLETVRKQSDAVVNTIRRYSIAPKEKEKSEKDSASGIAPASPAVPLTPSEDLRAALIQYFVCYAPERLVEIPRLLKANSTNPQQCKLELRREFNLTPIEHEAALVMKHDVRTRMIVFYAHYNPLHISSVDDILDKYAGQEEEVWALLERKYGPEQPLDALYKNWQELIDDKPRQQLAGPTPPIRSPAVGSPVKPASPAMPVAPATLNQNNPTNPLAREMESIVLQFGIRSTFWDDEQKRGAAPSARAGTPAPPAAVAANRSLLDFRTPVNHNLVWNMSSDDYSLL